MNTFSQQPSTKAPSRRENRMAAVQFLYMWSFNQSDNLSESLQLFFQAIEKPPESYTFAYSLIQGVLSYLTTIDDTIRQYAQNWAFHRIDKIDLAILRLAIFELLYRNDIPPIVSINEAIELGKIFSTPDSKRFVNGILDKLKDTLNRSPRNTP